MIVKCQAAKTCILALMLYICTTALSGLSLREASAQGGFLSAPSPTATPSAPPPPLRISEFSLTTIPAEYFSPEMNTAKDMLAQGEFEGAAAMINKEITATSKRAPLQKAYILQGLMFSMQKDYAEAIKAYDRYLALHAANSDVLYLKGQAQAASGDIQTALNTLMESHWFGKYTFLSPSDAFLQKSLIYLHLNDKVKASENLTKALSAKSNSAAVLIELANLQLAEGKRAEAIAGLRNAVSADPENDHAKVVLARALLTDVRRGTAEKDIKDARELAKSVAGKETSALKIKEEASALHVRSAIEDEDLPGAAELLKKYQADFPKSSELQAIRQQLDIERRIASEKAEAVATPASP